VNRNRSVKWRDRSIFSIRSVTLNFSAIMMLKKSLRTSSFALKESAIRTCSTELSAVKRKLNVLRLKSVRAVDKRLLNFRNSTCKKLRTKRPKTNLSITLPGSNLRNNGKLRRINGAKKIKLVSTS